MVFRIFVEKKGIHAVEAKKLLGEIKNNLLIKSVEGVRVVNRYDVMGITKEIFDSSMYTVFSEPQMDNVYEELSVNENDKILAVEYLPGQYDQRADFCAQCIQIISQKARPTVKSAKIYVVSGEVSEEDFDRIKKFLINPVESREAKLAKPETLIDEYELPTTVETLKGFIEANEEELFEYIKNYSLAMDKDDILFCQNYFKNEEKRDPTITELRIIDSYWSDHCRHTTFQTAIDNVYIDDQYIYDTFLSYLKTRDEIYGSRQKNVTLMDMATISGKYLKRMGYLSDLDESEEINACSVKIKVDTDKGEEDWLLMFKNETHNHPTEIEPFGGAATCLGGAIRDPLSGRSYVYQAMRVTGAADICAPLGETLKGKLPQSQISKTAAAGYSSYGNQIGLATGGVFEIYHPGYVAKRMEIGAVVGAAPAENVIREVPEPGDIIILLGGRTGRDGCGGATGSSKAHTEQSLESCGAEVQKGNPPEERKLQRLFRNPKAAQLIRRCNDFGAGGVCVAIGELADGLYIDLNKVPKKYEGLDGTELAISESQERMAVVVSAANCREFIELAEKENLEATAVASVTLEKRLKMVWNNNTIVDLSRSFLNSNGAEKHTDVAIKKQNVSDLNCGLKKYIDKTNVKESVMSFFKDLNIASQKGLVEMFDSTIGAGSVVMPFGGKYQLTPSQYMAAKIPVLGKETRTCSTMAYGFNPYVSEKSPYHGAIYAIVESVSKLVASGADYKTIRLTLQEYFEKTKGDPQRWGKPMAALLGAYLAQYKLSIAAIGGKDSMSGSFEDLDVPPTLVSFAICTQKADKLITNELKNTDSKIYLLKALTDENGVVDFDDLKKLYVYVNKLINAGSVLSAASVGFGGAFEVVSKMAFGNKIGVEFVSDSIDTLFDNNCGAIVIETKDDIDGELIAYTNENSTIKIFGETLDIDEIIETWESKISKIFPLASEEQNALAATSVETVKCDVRSFKKPLINVAKPKVFIPVFPGTNCEYDTAAAFERAGAAADVFVFRNITSEFLEDSLKEMAKRIEDSQILMIPGGFSAGDEPDGSGKFITAVMRNERIKDAVMKLLNVNDGLALGICNGFQALIKLGLLPYGKIKELSSDDPTLTFNSIGRHQSKLVNTVVSSVKSPWFSEVNVGDIHTIAISHGEGRFAADEKTLERLKVNGQIATQYVDVDGKATMDPRFNPNCSALAIEGIFSEDGRVFGKMGHSERYTSNTFRNVPGNKDQKIFESGVKYFK